MWHQAIIIDNKIHIHVVLASLFRVMQQLRYHLYTYRTLRVRQSTFSIGLLSIAPIDHQEAPGRYRSVVLGRYKHQLLWNLQYQHWAFYKALSRYWILIKSPHVTLNLAETGSIIMEVNL